MDGRMFDGLFTALVTFGVIIGIALCGLGWLAWWLFQHIEISWVSQ